MLEYRDTREGANRGEFEQGADMRELHQLATEEVRRHGEVPAVPVRFETGVAIPAAAADVPKTCAGCCGRCGKAGRVDQEAVK